MNNKKEIKNKYLENKLCSVHSCWVKEEMKTRISDCLENNDKDIISKIVKS